MTRHTNEAVLEAGRLTDRQDAFCFLRECLPLDSLKENNLDALNDALSEITEDTRIITGRATLKQICENDYAWKVLRVLARAADENPHLHLRLVN